MIKLSLFLFLVAITGFQLSCTGEERPNIILIMSDDHAKKAISAYDKSLIQTPNIDRLAREGLLFENAFVTNSICAPSRAVILTGKYSHINGLRDNRDRFDDSQVTFPKLLQKAGYYTALVGKWHLKSQPQGFDYWNILKGQGQYYNPDFIQMEDTLRYDGYCTDIVTDIAIEVLKNKTRDKPFCLLLHHKAPHRNFMPDLKHLNLFKDKNIPIPPNFFDDYQTRSRAAKEQDLEIAKLYDSFDLKLNVMNDSDINTGGKAGFDANKSWESTYNRFTPEQKEAWNVHYDSLKAYYVNTQLKGRALAEWKYQCYIRDYLRCVVSIDENVGRLLEYLDNSDLSENTIVIYTSDQGFFLGEHGWYDKRFMYEESAGIPLLARFPGLIEKDRKNLDLVLNLDLGPTILDLAGVPIPPDMQGVSLLPLLKDDKVEKWRQSIYYHYYEYPHGWHDVKKHYGVRTDRYKLIHFYDDIDAWELYDLKTDPMEMNNIYNDNSQQVTITMLKKELQRLQKVYRDSVEFNDQ